ncbi:MAG: hypothetical protein RLZZ546_293 [Bacteroidota bacterium]|jgi:hypothetical protein
MSLKIYASGIKDLTSARYFSAMNVEILGFEVNTHNLEKISEMIHWISVPFISVEFHDTDPQITNFINTNDWIDYIVTPLEFECLKPRFKITTYDFLHTMDPADTNHIVKIEEPISHLNEVLPLLSNKPNVFVDIFNLSKDHIPLLIESNIYGLVMRAESENKVGLQSFDHYDEIFEKLEQL